MKAIVKERVLTEIAAEFNIGDIVQSTTTEEIGIVVDAIPEEDTYQIFFFKTEEIVPYNSDYICNQPVFHVPIDDISDIKRYYFEKDKLKSVPLTMKSEG